MGIPAKYAPVDTAEKSPTRAFDTGGQADMSEGFPGVTKRAQAEMNFKRSFYNGTSLIQSSGNALMEYNEKEMADMVRVTVPEGCMQNQIIQVTHPDSHDRFAMVRIPLGCSPGTTFLANIPQDQRLNDLELEQEKANAFTSAKNGQIVVDSHELNMPNHHPIQSLNGTNRVENKRSNRTETILVNTPQGVSAGTLIHVRTPGNEGNIIPVMVPEGNPSQFYVEYDPDAAPELNRMT